MAVQWQDYWFPADRRRDLPEMTERHVVAWEKAGKGPFPLIEDPVQLPQKGYFPGITRAGPCISTGLRPGVFLRPLARCSCCYVPASGLGLSSGLWPGVHFVMFRLLARSFKLICQA